MQYTEPNLSEYDELKVNTNQSYDPSEHFRKFILEIRSNMQKCNYRKALVDLESKEEIFEGLDIEDLWKIKELKVLAMIKIVRKKFFKSESPKYQKIKSIENWMKKIDDLLNSWLNNVTLEEHNQQEIEALLILNLKQKYFEATYRISENSFIEAITILSYAENIIKNFCQYAINPDFLNISQEILLLTSNLIIADGNYEESISYIKRIITLCFSELVNRLNIEDKENLLEGRIRHKHKYEKIFRHIVIAFYQRGMVQENSGKIRSSIDSYLQSSWFANYFLGNSYPEFTSFVMDVHKRVTQYNNLIEFKLKEKIKDIKPPMKKEKAISNIKLDLFFKNKEILLKEKEKEINDFLSKMNFTEFDFLDDDHLSENVRNILSIVILFNNFTSLEFRDILKEDINVNGISNMERSLVEKIQKRLNELRAEKNYNQIEDKKKKEKVMDMAKQTFDLQGLFKRLSNKDSQDSLILQKDNEDKDCNIKENTINNGINSLKGIFNINASIKINKNDLPGVNIEENYNDKIKEKEKEEESSSNSNGQNKEKKQTSLFGVITEQIQTEKEKNLIADKQKKRKSKSSILAFGISSSTAFGSVSSNHLNNQLNNLNQTKEKKNQEMEYSNNIKNRIPTEHSAQNIKKENQKETTKHKKSKSLTIRNKKKNLLSKPVVKYEHDEYTLSKIYQNKLSNIDHLLKKEINFQKKMLKLKQNEKMPLEKNEIPTKKQIKKNAEGYFDRIIRENKNKLLIEKDEGKIKQSKFKDGLSYKEDKILNKLEISLIKSGDTKSYSEWSKFLNDKKVKENRKMKEAFLAKGIKTISSPLAKEETKEQKNANTKKKLEKELLQIDKEEKIFTNIISPKIELFGENFHHRKPEIKSKYTKKYENGFKVNADEFVKIEKTNIIGQINNQIITSIPDMIRKKSAAVSNDQNFRKSFVGKFNETQRFNQSRKSMMLPIMKKTNNELEI